MCSLSEERKRLKKRFESREGLEVPGEGDLGQRVRLSKKSGRESEHTYLLMSAETNHSPRCNGSGSSGLYQSPQISK